jgi:cysteinyl-tRNA synthetase
MKVIDSIVKILIEQRNEARKRKDFAAADEMRDLLDKNGIVLEDKPGETVWRFK